MWARPCSGSSRPSAELFPPRTTLRGRRAAPQSRQERQTEFYSFQARQTGLCEGAFRVFGAFRGKEGRWVVAGCTTAPGRCGAVGAVGSAKAGDDVLSHSVSRAVPSARRGLTTVFGMGTGVALAPLPPARWQDRARAVLRARVDPSMNRGWERGEASRL